MSVGTADGHSSIFILHVCYALNHYSTQIIHTQHLWGLQKFRGRGHSSAQLWQITINSLLQIFHVFKGNVVPRGTFTPCSQQSQKLPEGYLKNPSPYLHQDHKKPHSSREQMLFQPSFQQLQQLPFQTSTLPDTSEHRAALAGPAWCIAVSPAGGRSAACCRPQSPSCFFF